MAKYLLTGIDNDVWKHFKASCDLMGVTIKQTFLEYIDIIIEETKLHPGPYKPWPIRPKKGGKKR